MCPVPAELPGREMRSDGDRELTVMFLNLDMKRRRTGIENAALMRARMFERELGIVPHILTVNYDAHFLETRDELLRDGFVTKNTVFRNLYDWFQEMDSPRRAESPSAGLWKQVDVPGTLVRRGSPIPPGTRPKVSPVDQTTDDSLVDVETCGQGTGGVGRPAPNGARGEEPSGGGPCVRSRRGGSPGSNTAHVRQWQQKVRDRGAGDESGDGTKHFRPWLRDGRGLVVPLCGNLAADQQGGKAMHWSSWRACVTAAPSSPLTSTMARRT